MLNSVIIRGAAYGIVIVGGTLYAMQSGWIGSQGQAEAEITTAESIRTTPSQPAEPRSMTPVLPEIDENADLRLPTTLEAVSPEARSIQTAFGTNATMPVPVTLTPAMSEEQSADVGVVPGLPCDILVTATSMPTAMVALDVMAPCRAEASVQITYAGLRLAAQTDVFGLLTMDFPTTQTPDLLTVGFEDGLEKVVLVGLPDLADYDSAWLSGRGILGSEFYTMELTSAHPPIQ